MTLLAPLLSFRSASAPYGVIGSLSYAQSAPGGNYLPLAGGEISNIQSFRVYNNYTRSTGVASMINIYLTTFDGADPNSHTATQSPVAQSWVRVYETGYGESAGAPGLYTSYLGTDTAIGRSGGDPYIPEYGSDGSTTAQIRAGTDTNGLGFIEFASYVQAPDTIGFVSYTFAVSFVYDHIV